MRLTPDEVVLWAYGPLHLNATIVTTWGIMVLLAGGSRLVTRRLSHGESPSRWQLALEAVVTGIEEQLREAGLVQPERFLPFLGTLFLFLVTAAWLTILPGYESPSSSLSTTTALAVAAFVAVPVYGMRTHGLRGYLAHYLQPTPIMLPFNIIEDFSRTLALAVRLFGNAMSGGLVLGILLTVAPFFFPVLTSLLELLTGTVQAYIFAVLATVYVAAAVRVPESLSSPTEGAPQ
jgi:F-type H+-transporting ATPase subunit a